MHHFTFRSFKWVVLLISFLTISTAFIVNKEATPSSSTYKPVHGESVTYKASFGGINIIEGNFTVQKPFFRMNGRLCHRVDVTGKTIGLFGKTFTINNLWMSFIDKDKKVSQMFLRDITEGKYRLHETNVYNQNEKSITVTKDKSRALKYTLTKSEIHDMISAYFHLRSINFTKQRIGQITTIFVFFDTKPYNFQIQYQGTETIQTKFGKMNAIKLVPIMPDNKVFASENPVTVWISNDQNKIPLKAKANLVIGNAELNIDSFSGLKKPLLAMK